MKRMSIVLRKLAFSVIYVVIVFAVVVSYERIKVTVLVEVITL